jgi:hypothetical protein
MTQLGPVVLPYSEMIKFGANMAVRMAARSSKSVAQALPASWQKQYVPDFRKAFDYFCIHTGDASFFRLPGLIPTGWPHTTQPSTPDCLGRSLSSDTPNTPIPMPRWLPLGCSGTF